MKVEELKGVEHVSVVEKESGMVTVKVDDGYCLKATVMVEKAVEPTEMPVGLPEGDAGVAAAEGTETLEATSYARVIYCRKDSVLPDYVVVDDSVPDTEKETAEQ